MEHAARSRPNQQHRSLPAERTAAPGAAASFIDHRPEAVAQRKLSEAIEQSPRVPPQRAMIAGIQNSPRMVAQRQQLRSIFGNAAQLEGEPEEEADCVSSSGTRSQSDDVRSQGQFGPTHKKDSVEDERLQDFLVMIQRQGGVGETAAQQHESHATTTVVQRWPVKFKASDEANVEELTRDEAEERLNSLDISECDRLRRAVKDRVIELRRTDQSDPQLTGLLKFDESVSRRVRGLRKQQRVPESAAAIGKAEKATTDAIDTLANAKPAGATPKSPSTDQFHSSAPWCQALAKLSQSQPKASTFFEALKRLEAIAKRSPLITKILNLAVCTHPEMELALQPELLPDRAQGSYQDTLRKGVLKLSTATSAGMVSLESTTLHELTHRLIWRVVQNRGQPFGDMPQEFKEGDQGEMSPILSEWKWCSVTAGPVADKWETVTARCQVGSVEKARVREKIIARAKNLCQYKKTDFSLEVYSHYMEVRLILAELFPRHQDLDEAMDPLLFALFPQTHEFFKSNLLKMIPTAAGDANGGGNSNI